MIALLGVAHVGSLLKEGVKDLTVPVLTGIIPLGMIVCLVEFLAKDARQLLIARLFSAILFWESILQKMVNLVLNVIIRVKHVDLQMSVYLVLMEI